MKQFFKRSVQDIFSNLFLSVITTVTIAFSVLMVSMFCIMSVNAGKIIRIWSEGIRIMVYLNPDVSEEAIEQARITLESFNGIRNVKFISGKEGLEILKSQMERQASLFDHLRDNPLPDAFEITLEESFQNIERLEYLASQIEVLPSVEEVEYGQKWLGRFSNILNFFRLFGYTMGVLFFIASMFFMANTIRLLLYSRRIEVDVLKFAGATNSFIQIPFYLQSALLCFVGGIVGAGGAFGVYQYLAANLEKSELADIIKLQFLPVSMIWGILTGTVLVGILGCFLSLKQYFK